MQNVKYVSGDNFQYLESGREAFSDLFLVHMGREECKPYHAVSARRTEYIIHFVISGYGFYSVRDNTWSVSAGQMFLIYPDEPVVYCADKNVPWSYAWIGFRGLRVESILKKCGFSKDRLVLPTPPQERYQEIFNAFFNHIVPDFSNSLYREALLLKLLSLLVETHSNRILAGSEKARPVYENSYVAEAVNYISKTYAEAIGVTEIAEHVGISRAHLNHAFQEELNVSVQNYLMDFRMRKAANLLAETKQPIKAISDAVGYEDQLVFSKAFKKKYGMSPKNYRFYQNEMERRGDEESE